MPSPAAQPSIGAKLIRWSSRGSRNLPWRRSRDPYRVWISEIMLQQTRVETVIPYYRRFLKKFPRVKIWRRPISNPYCKYGKGSVITPAPGTCIRPPGK